MAVHAPPQATRLEPVELVVLQGSSFCNLDCIYCDLSPQSRRRRQVMAPSLIDRVFRELFSSGYVAPEVTVIWHSGEPLTLPPAYYDDAIARISRLNQELTGGAIAVRFDIQTNGVLINEGWCEFFRRHADHLNVGVSCDGPGDMHDAFRVSRAGRGSHARTLRGMTLLREHDIRFKVIAVVTEATLADPARFFGFFRAWYGSLSGFHFNVLAAANGVDAALTYGVGDRDRYYNFYRALLGLTRTATEEGDPLVIQNFTQGMARIAAARETRDRTVMEETSAPLKSLNVDAEGNVTSFYAGLPADAHRHIYGDGEGLCLGNIRRKSLEELVKTDKLRRIVRDFAASSAACCAACSYFAVCTGGFELTKMTAHGRFDATETPECVIHVQALTDALLDDATDHLERHPSCAAAH